MSWLRAGDTAALYTPLMLTATLGDDRTVNEVAGWIHRCMEQAASQRTDYLIDMGTAALLGGSRLPELIRLCKKVKLIKVVRVDGFEYIEVIKDPAFLHVRLKAEQDWENQRKRDNSNPTLTAQVRLRDGDGCRWCGVVTYWGTPDQRSARVGTYDHLEPGQDGTVATMVVACRLCNSSRQNDRDGWTRPLLEVPAPPFFSTATAAFIAKHLGVQVVPSDQRPGSQPDTAPGEPAASWSTPPPPAGRAIGRDDFSASDRPVPADRRPPVSGNVGSGRDGSGRAGTEQGLVGIARAPATRSKRSRRGRGRPR